MEMRRATTAHRLRRVVGLALLPCLTGNILRTPHASGRASSALVRGRAVVRAAASLDSSVETKSAVQSADWATGPNPFEIVRPLIEPLSCSIKTLLSTDHAVLTMVRARPGGFTEAHAFI